MHIGVCVFELLVGCLSMLSYLWGEHGQESNGPTLHALHPEQGVTIVLPTKFYIEHSNEEKVHPHEAVCTWTIRDGESIYWEESICQLLPLPDAKFLSKKAVWMGFF